MEFGSPEFWVAVAQIIAIDIVLGGDNAVFIALACRRLPHEQRNKAVFWGVFGAIALRVVLIFFALYLLKIPYLKIGAAALLLWIGVKLLLPEGAGEGGGHQIDASAGLLGAIKTILIADVVMSLDNVIAIAGAAKDSIGLVIFGLVVSVPIIVWGSKLVLALMDRFPVVIVAGAALLGWIAGEMTVTDVTVKDWASANAPFLHWAGPAAGAVLVVVIGKWIAARAIARRAALVDLGEPIPVPAATEAAALPGLANRVLLPVDTSDNAARAVEYVLAMRRRHPAPGSMDIHLLNVQRPVSGDVSSFIARDSLQDYHRERGQQALGRARKLLDAAGVKYSYHLLVGKPWEAISDYARTHGCDHIVMGTRGLGSHTGGLLGSVAHGVAQSSPVPLVLVK